MAKGLVEDPKMLTAVGFSMYIPVAMMIIILVMVIGCILATFGFAAMRDPIRFASFRPFVTPQVEGYYQRMVLDRHHRVYLRILGMFFSFFGLMILTVGLDGLMKLKVVHAVSEGFLLLMGASFISVFTYGLADAIVQGIRGRGAELMFGWYRMWKESMELGPVAAFPAYTPRMDREKKLFTAVYSVLVISTLVVALWGCTLP